MKHCNVCGKPLTLITDKGEISCVSLELLFTIPDGSPELQDFYRSLIGSYTPGKRYNVCQECWLKSLGVKP